MYIPKQESKHPWPLHMVVSPRTWAFGSVDSLTIILLLPIVTKLWFILQIKPWLLWVFHNPAYMHFFSSESLNKLQISRVFDINWWLQRKRAVYNNNNYFIWWIRCFEKKTKNRWSYVRKTSETISDSAECNWWLWHGSPILSKNSPLLSLLTVCIYLGSLLGLSSPSTMYVYVSFKI